MRKRLREGTVVRLNKEEQDISEASLRSDSDPLAESGEHKITCGRKDSRI